jgi:TetR/AcrR family transcriptional regulator, cholesterol catabolism regulator
MQIRPKHPLAIKRAGEQANARRLKVNLKTVNPSPENATPREKVLSVAAQMFRRQGYTGTTTRELATALNIQKSTLYHYITNKEDLLYQLCLLAFAQIRSAVTAAANNADTPREQLRALIKAHLQTVLADCHLHVTQMIEMRSLSDKSRAHIVSLRNEYEEGVFNLIRSAQRANEISSHYGPRELTLGLLNLMNWTMFWYQPEGDLSPEELVDCFTDLFLNGCGVKQAGPRQRSTPKRKR